MRYSRFSHRHLLRIRGCFVVRGGGAILAEQVPPPCSNGGRWFTAVGQPREAVLAAWGVPADGHKVLKRRAISTTAILRSFAPTNTWPGAAMRCLTIRTASGQD